MKKLRTTGLDVKYIRTPTIVLLAISAFEIRKKTLNVKSESLIVEFTDIGHTGLIFDFVKILYSETNYQPAVINTV